MKQLFRGVLIMKYTDNQEEITEQKLIDYLKEQNSYDDSFAQQVQNLEQLIDDLIQDDSSEIFEQYGLNRELSTIWANEKDRVLSFYIKKQTQGQKIEKFQWSVNNQFYGKKQKNINKPVCIMNLKSKDVSTKEFKFHTFEIEDLTYVLDELKRIEQTIDALLL